MPHPDGPDQRGHALLGNVEAHVVDCALVAVVDVQVLDGEFRPAPVAVLGPCGVDGFVGFGGGGAVVAIVGFGLCRAHASSFLRKYVRETMPTA